MNTPNDAANAEDFEALYLAYRAKYEAAQKDAERYRWLRFTFLFGMTNNQFDAVVDAAIEQTNGR